MVLAGGALLGGVSVLGGGSRRSSAGIALGGALLGMAIESMKVKDIHYALVTDVEIRQRPLEGETGVQNDKMASKQGSSATSNQTFTNNNVKWKVYRTRIVSSAYGAGLDFELAQPFFGKSSFRNTIGLIP